MKMWHIYPISYLEVKRYDTNNGEFFIFYHYLCTCPARRNFSPVHTFTSSLCWLCLLMSPFFAAAQVADTLPLPSPIDTLETLATDTGALDTTTLPVEIAPYHTQEPDHNQWNNLLVSLFQNRAMTGFNHQHNFLLQWEAPFYASRQFGGHSMFAYDFNVPMLNEKHPGKFNWGTGIYYRAMGYGGRFKRTQFGISHGFSANLKKGGQLRVGFEFFNFYIHPLTSEQVDGNIAPNQGTGTRVRPGQLAGGVLGYGMVNFGVWYQKPNYFIGAALNNINTLEGWHFKGDEAERAMPMEAYVHGGYHFRTGPIVITPMLEYYSKNITVQTFRPRINIQSLGGRLLTGIGYGSKTATATVGYRTRYISFMAEGGVSTHTYGPLRGGWVASGQVLIHFKGAKNKLAAAPAPTPTQP